MTVGWAVCLLVGLAVGGWGYLRFRRAPVGIVLFIAYTWPVGFLALLWMWVRGKEIP